MFYYLKDNSLYASMVPLSDENYTELTEAEYKRRMSSFLKNRETGEPSALTDEWW